MSLRIGLNATCFNDMPSGANQRFRGIYGALIRNHPDLEFVLFEPADCSVGRWFEGAPNLTVRRTKLPSRSRIRRTASSLTYWRAALRRERLDLFETFHMPLVRAPDCPTIMTVHDIRSVSTETPYLKRLLYTPVMTRALRGADHIITVSHAMKAQILEIAPEARITPIYNGIDPKRWEIAPGTAASAREALGIPPEFLLSVGHLESRKNYVRLVEAVAALRAAGRALPLVIVGNDAGEGPAVAAAIRRLHLEGEVRILSGLDDETLTALYAEATLVVFPSRYEGFGIPILEAMAAGCPLLLSDIGVFRELTEGQGYYVPPDDSEAMAAGIAELLANDERRAKLVAYGRRRIADFAFPELAEQVARLYRSLL